MNHEKFRVSTFNWGRITEAHTNDKLICLITCQEVLVL